MSDKRYTEEFKVEAINQTTKRGHSVSEVSHRLGVSSHSLYAWLKNYGKERRLQLSRMTMQPRKKRLHAELKRVTEERDIEKRPSHTSPKSPSEVRVGCSNNLLSINNFSRFLY